MCVICEVYYYYAYDLTVVPAIHREIVIYNSEVLA